VAAREALGETARSIWPDGLTERACGAAIEAVTATAESLAHDHGSPARRRRVRDALGAALRLAAACDIARAGGHDADGAQRAAGRAIVALALLLHANLYVPNA
jgi:hypothetical protein